MDSKYKTPTCSRCKSRKMRCDGLTPCHSCTPTNGECRYDSKEPAVGSELRKGAACLACRRKKKKCDGKLPCRTCATSRKKLKCEYPDGMLVDLENPTPPENYRGPALYRNNSPESGSSNDSSPVYVTIPVDTSNLPQIQVIDDDISSPSPFTTRELLPAQPTSFVDVPELIQARDIFLDRVSDKAPSQDSIEKALVDFAGAPWPIEPTPFFQVPDPNPDDELYQIRQLFLLHRIQHGLNLPAHRLEAISKGVATPNVIHPILIYVCQLTGYMLARHLHNNTWLNLPGRSPGEVEQTNLVLISLTTFGQMACPTAYVQTCNLLAIYFSNKGDLARAREILIKGHEMAVDHNVHKLVLMPPSAEEAGHTGFKITPPNPEAEVQATLSQGVYLDIAFNLLLGVPRVLDPRLDQAFRKLIDAPNSRVEINFVRAKSALLLWDAKRLVNEWSQGSMDEAAISKWQNNYWHLVELLDGHRSLISVTLIKLAFFPNLRTLLLSLKVCAIITLTALAELLALFAAEQSELQRRKHEAILEIISMSSGFSKEDCDFLDPILSICWRMVVHTVEGCMKTHGEAVKETMHDLPAMAVAIRQQNMTLQRALPNVMDL
ncbi:hypothetical protein FB45DRAFT_445290 [Roridomyces roridus]|uniref:Zn(2)-C6 fungal-type domain-containing protein n=1 Tax=Roridomyces roridus TaxID=1738132 RepID=A0AAD7FS37_9AGAR|nr:hypothetical protein FB45DRAFT_445290 [Roridomyces roridus]